MELKYLGEAYLAKKAKRLKGVVGRAGLDAVVNENDAYAAIAAIAGEMAELAHFGLEDQKLGKALRYAAKVAFATTSGRRNVEGNEMSIRAEMEELLEYAAWGGKGFGKGGEDDSTRLASKVATYMNRKVDNPFSRGTPEERAHTARARARGNVVSFFRGGYSYGHDGDPEHWHDIKETYRVEVLKSGKGVMKVRVKGLKGSYGNQTISVKTADRPKWNPPEGDVASEMYSLADAGDG